MKALYGGRWRVGEHLIPQALVQMLWALLRGHKALWNMPLHFFILNNFYINFEHAPC